MQVLFESLSLRKRPEDIADRVMKVLGARLDERAGTLLRRAAKGSLRQSVQVVTSMMQDFARPVGLRVQVRRAEVIFEGVDMSLEDEDCADWRKVEAFIEALGVQIHRSPGASDFMSQRLNREDRKARGLKVSRRKYNRRFRHLVRMERKLKTLVREWKKYELLRVGKSGLATSLSFDEFSSNTSSACFIAYFTARSNMRSEFTVSGQSRPYDEIADMLFDRCRKDESSNWWAIAHVYPSKEVLARLSEEQKGRLLGTWDSFLNKIAGLLSEVWNASTFDRHSMVVRRGNDSTTWNSTASAWNRARSAWISLVHAMGMESILYSMCLGKVPRLMAAEVVRWHQAVGGGLHPDTKIWADLPLPWCVLSGEQPCSQIRVRAICERHGVDPETTGWIGPKRTGAIAAYRPTPELVHGVSVGSPKLASIIRKAGWFSGKPKGAANTSLPGVLHEEIIGKHRSEKERQRSIQRGSAM